VQETRIDQAHQHGGDPQILTENISIEVQEEDALVSPGEPVVEDLPQDLAEEQLRRQAEQLAEYLRARQRELDHREAQLNAQLAQLESDVRTARIWLGEREAEIQEREQSRVALEEEFRKRLARLASADAALERQKEEFVRNAGPAQENNFREAISEIASMWGVQSEQLAEDSARQAELAEDISPRTRMRFDAAHAKQEVRHRDHERELTRKRLELEEAEQKISDAQLEIRSIRKQLLDERHAQREELRIARKRLADEQRQAVAELDTKRESLEKRAEHVENCRTALVQLRSELQGLHRETLEIRLATEELWAQLSGAAPPAALTRSLGRIRTRLADQYRMANAELFEQKKELASIRDQLAAQYEKLIGQKQQFELWANGRREEAEQQASRLIEREQELADAAVRFTEHSQRWEIERREYEQEIRSMRLKLMPHEGSSKVA
jgi:chromosome segregation ATPase